MQSEQSVAVPPREPTATPPTQITNPSAVLLRATTGLRGVVSGVRSHPVCSHFGVAFGNDSGTHHPVAKHQSQSLRMISSSNKPVVCSYLGMIGSVTTPFPRPHCVAFTARRHTWKVQDRIQLVARELAPDTSLILLQFYCDAQPAFLR